MPEMLPFAAGFVKPWLLVSSVSKIVVRLRCSEVRDTMREVAFAMTSFTRFAEARFVSLREFAKLKPAATDATTIVLL
jgi:hypothetical protein